MYLSEWLKVFPREQLLVLALVLVLVLLVVLLVLVLASRLLTLQDLPLAGSLAGGAVPRVPVGVAEGLPQGTAAGAAHGGLLPPPAGHHAPRLQVPGTASVLHCTRTT